MDELVSPVKCTIHQERVYVCCNKPNRHKQVIKTSQAPVEPERERRVSSILYTPENAHA